LGAAPRTPILFEAGPGIVGVDTGMVGQRELNAVYILTGSAPTLVEAGPGADLLVVTEALNRVGLSAGDLAHVVVTHIHVDHAGATGALTERYPRASVWVHERGAPHLVDPTRLVASTARTYGEERMLAFYGETLPVAADRIRTVVDGDRIPLGERSLSVLSTPGHASHHVALQDSASGAVFTGEAIGSHLPWADSYRPALPPPEVDVEMALDSIERIRSVGPTALLTSHFGPVPDAEEGCRRGAERIRAWSETVRRILEGELDADADVVTSALTAQATEEFYADAGEPIDLARYDALGSIRMNATGLSRYWRKRWERESAAP
jgi:glyoxylase-like metal-dependent hydrolase (beta-lactamase superfamily II)